MNTWLMFAIAIVVVMDTFVLYYVLVHIRPRLMKLGRTMAEHKETLAAAKAVRDWLARTLANHGVPAAGARETLNRLAA